MKKTYVLNPEKRQINFMSRANWVTRAMVFLMVSILAFSMESSASHFRYGHLTWQKVSGNIVRFTLTDAFRRSGYNGGAVAIGDIITENIGGTSLSFGDGNNTGVLQYIVTAIDPAEDWLIGQALQPGSSTKTTIDYTYATPNNAGSPWVAEVNASARTGVEQNNPNANYRLLTYVETVSGNTSPSSSLPAIVKLTRSATSSFFVPGADPDPSSALRWRLATGLEAANGTFNQPSGLTVNNLTGLVTWNTLATVLGGLYSCQIVIEDRDAATGAFRTQVPVDFLIEIVDCNPNNIAPAFISPTPICGSSMTVLENSPLSFIVSASDANGAQDVVTLNSGGLPSGATMSPVLPVAENPVSSTFNWTPGSGTAGSYVVTFSATDNCGSQTICSFTINVIACTPPSCSVTATPCNNTFTGGVPTNIYLGYGPQCATLNVNLTGGAPSSYSWTGNYLSCTNCAHPVFTPTAPGNYTLSVTVTTTQGCSTTCSISFCVLDIRVPGSNANDKKVYLCHLPPGNPANAQLLSISVNAVPAHLGNHTGDHLGRCDQVCGRQGRTAKPGEMLIVDDKDDLEMLVYPNPFSNGFHIKFDNINDSKVNIRLFNMAGQTIQILNDQMPDHEISLGSDLSPGIYFLEVQQGDFRKVVKVNKAE